MAQYAPQRTLSFFQLRHELGNAHRAPDTDWKSWVGERVDRPARENVHEEMHFEHMLDREVPVVCIHKRLNSTMLTRMDDSTGSVEDVSESDTEVARLMQSTVIVFLGQQYIGVARGQLGGAQQGALIRYLEDRKPLADGWHWATQPVMREGDRSQIAESSGVTRIEAHYRTSALLGVDDPGPARGISSVIAGGDRMLDAEFDIKTTIQARGDKKAGARVLRQIVLDEMSRFTDAAVHGSHPHVVATFEDDEAREVYLTSHPLASTVTLTGHDYTFSSLVGAVVNEALAQRSNLRGT